MATSIPAQVAHALKCKHKNQQFTGHILSSDTTDKYRMEYQCECGAYIYELTGKEDLSSYQYPTDNEWKRNQKD